MEDSKKSVSQSHCSETTYRDIRKHPYYPLVEMALQLGHENFRPKKKLEQCLDVSIMAQDQNCLQLQHLRSPRGTRCRTSRSSLLHFVQGSVAWREIRRQSASRNAMEACNPWYQNRFTKLIPNQLCQLATPHTKLYQAIYNPGTAAAGWQAHSRPATSVGN